MMITRSLTMILLVLLASPLAAQKVLVDYDRDADFPSYKTYAWLEPVEASLADTDPLMHTRIRNEIEMRISEGENALQRVDSDPDIYVTYHAEGQEEVRFSTTSVGYGYGAGWGWNPYWGGAYGGGMSTTTAHTYVQGSLVVDFYDARTKKALWRGTAENIVASNPAKTDKQITKVIGKMASIWRKEYRKRF